MRRITERRISHRYEVHLPLHYRVSRRGSPAINGIGTTREVSSAGLSFRCRRSLPPGAHVELIIDWPARYRQQSAVELVVTGQIIRSDGGRIAVRMSSRKFRVEPAHDTPLRATA